MKVSPEKISQIQQAELRALDFIVRFLFSAQPQKDGQQAPGKITEKFLELMGEELAKKNQGISMAIYQYPKPHYPSTGNNGWALVNCYPPRSKSDFKKVSLKVDIYEWKEWITLKSQEGWIGFTCKLPPITHDIGDPMKDDVCSILMVRTTEDPFNLSTSALKAVLLSLQSILRIVICKELTEAEKRLSEIIHIRPQSGIGITDYLKDLNDRMIEVFKSSLYPQLEKQTGPIDLGETDIVSAKAFLREMWQILEARDAIGIDSGDGRDVIKRSFRTILTNNLENLSSIIDKIPSSQYQSELKKHLDALKMVKTDSSSTDQSDKDKKESDYNAKELMILCNKLWLILTQNPLQTDFDKIEKILKSKETSESEQDHIPEKEKYKEKEQARALALRWAAAERFYRAAELGDPFDIAANENKVREVLVNNGNSECCLVYETETCLWKMLKLRSDCLKKMYAIKQEEEPTQKDNRQDKKPRGNQTQKEKAYLFLDTQWLRLYFLWMLFGEILKGSKSGRIRALVSPQSDQGFESPIELRIEFFSHLTRFVRDTLRFELDGPSHRACIDVERYTRSMLFLVDFFVHEILELPERLDVLGHLRAFMDKELLLHLGEPYYRDHSFHVVETFFLGLLMLDLRYQREEDRYGRSTFAHSLIRGNNDHDPSNDEIRTFKRAWAMASLFHDTGYLLELPIAWGQDYPFQQVNAWKELGRNFEEADKAHRHRVNGWIKKEFQPLSILSETQIHCNMDVIDNVYQKTFDELIDGNELDHGVVSAWYLLKLLELIGEDAGPWKPAIEAVFLHNLHLPIYLDDQPLAGLLALCDEMQEWGRHRIQGPDFMPRSIVSAKFEYPMELPLKGHVRAICLSNITFTNENNNINHNIDNRYLIFHKCYNKEIHCTIQYGEPEILRAPTVVIWLSKAWNIRRISTCSHTFKIRIRTDVSEEFQRLKLCYQHLLARVAARHSGKELGLLLRPWLRQSQWKGYDCDSNEINKCSHSENNALIDQKASSEPEESESNPVATEEVTLYVLRDRPAPCLTIDPAPCFGTLLQEVKRVVHEQKIASLREVPKDVPKKEDKKHDLS